MNCPICRDPLLPDEAIKTCEECEYDFHRECWDVTGGCGTRGCPNLPDCKEQFETIEPITLEARKDSLTRHPQQIKERKGALIIFICGLLGITAPLNLLFGGLWYQKNQKKLCGASPIHNLLAILGLSISGFYSLLILLGILIG